MATEVVVVVWWWWCVCGEREERSGGGRGEGKLGGRRAWGPVECSPCRVSRSKASSVAFVVSKRWSKLGRLHELTPDDREAWANAALTAVGTAGCRRLRSDKKEERGGGTAAGAAAACGNVVVGVCGPGSWQGPLWNRRRTRLSGASRGQAIPLWRDF